MTNERVIQRWVDRMTGRSELKDLRVARIYANGDRLYSYGNHFELGRVLRKASKAGVGEPVGFLLNGDVYSVSTSRHQAIVRWAVEHSGLPSAIIPFQTLAAAGVDLSSVRILQATRDGHEEIRHRSFVKPEGGRHYVSTSTDEVGRTVYEWITYRHWLGESLIAASLPWHTRTVCKPCQGSGKAPNFPLIVTTKWERENWPMWERHDSPLSCVKCRGVGQISRSGARYAKFLSGFDANEARRSYFFCELPRTDALTVEAAYAALKPETVRLAEQMGRAVKRQGDIFAVPMPTLTKRSLRKMGATFTAAGNLLGTNHQATETAVLPDGTLLARGTLRHAPDFRAPDHARVTLGRDFHAIVKNTVPLSA